MSNVLLWIYGVIGIFTYWYDASALYGMDYPYYKAVLVGVIGGLLWPIRWGHDIVVYILNKRSKK